MPVIVVAAVKVKGIKTLYPTILIFTEMGVTKAPFESMSKVQPKFGL